MRKFANLCIVFAFLFGGGLLLSLDHSTTEGKLIALLSAVACFAFGLWLGRKLNKANALPE